MFEEKNTRSNLTRADRPSSRRWAMNTPFYSWPRAEAPQTRLSCIKVHLLLLREDLLLEYLDERIAALGTAACPPYHLAVVIGGTSAEMNLKTVKLVSARYLDDLPHRRQRAWSTPFVALK